MSFKRYARKAVLGVFSFVAVTFSQVISDSIPLPQGCTSPIKKVLPLCDFDNDGSIDLWVVGAKFRTWSNIDYTVHWYGIYSFATKSYLYYKSLPTDGYSVTNINDISANPIGSNIMVLFNGTILTYGDAPVLLKKK